MTESINDKINKRPLFTCCAAFSVAVVVGSFLGGGTVAGLVFSGLALVLFAVLATVAAVGVIKRRDGRRIAAAVAALTLLAGSAIPHIISKRVGVRLASTGGEHEITCRVTEITSRYPYFSSATVEVTGIDGEKASFSARLTAEGELDAGPGGLLRLKNAVISPIPEDENGFPAARYYAGRGIFYGIDCESFASEGSSPALTDRIAAFSERLSARLGVLCGRNEGGLASALFLGRKDSLPDSLKRDFSRLGISHLLAVSGLHLTMIVFFAEKTAAAIFRKRCAPLFVCIGLAVFYAVLTGLHYSVVRAAIMLTIGLTAKYAGRRADPLTSLGVASAVVLAVRPFAALDAGFLLSVLSVLGLITAGGPVSSALGGKTASRVLRYVIPAVVSTVSVLFFTLPVSWYVYGSVSPVSVVSNLIFVPLAALILLFTPVALLIPQFSPAAGAVCSAVIKLSERASGTSPDPLFVGYGFTPFCFLLSLCAAFTCLVLIKRTDRVRITVSCLAALAVLSGSFLICRAAVSPSVPDVSVVNAGSNDHIITDSGDGVILTDVSTGSASAAKTAASLGLRDVCRTNVDVIVYTHLHTLHVSSFDRLSDAYLITTVLIPSDADPAISERIGAIASEKGIDCVTYDAAPFAAGGLIFDFADPLEIRDRVHDALYFTVSSEDGSAAFCSPGYLASLPGDVPEKLFILSHGNTRPTGKAPGGAAALNRDTATGCGAAFFINDGRQAASLAFRLDG